MKEKGNWIYCKNEYTGKKKKHKQPINKTNSKHYIITELQIETTMLVYQLPVILSSGKEIYHGSFPENE